MDYPKAPDDARDWDSIDIYLFTNGQDYSPPRKYHIKAAELKLWGATLNILGRSQFGSLQSNIELYTLDGKKIDTPLELENDAAYVAVRPPETFIQTGYEKYLLKASRSWEKRHERLNSTEIVKSERENNELDRENIKYNLDLANDEAMLNNEIYNDLPLDTKIEYLPKFENSFNQSQRDINTKDNSVKTAELLQRRKPESYTKNTILKKFYPNSKSKDDGNNVNKKRNTSFPKNIMKSTYNSKRVPISSNNTNTLKTNLEQVKSNMKSKDKLQTNSRLTKDKLQTNSDRITETNEKTENLKNDPVVKISPGTSVKDLIAISDVYKNTESDVQSVFLDADRRTALLNNEQTKISPALGNIEEYRDTPENCLITNKANPQQSTSNLLEIQTPCNVNQPSTFNINLNIDLKGYTLFKSGDKSSESNKCKTYVKLMKLEKASQVNIDVNLSKEILNSGHEDLLREQSAESDIAKPCEEKFADNKTKVIVRCKCNPLRNFNENDHYIIVIPAEKHDKFMPRSDLESRQGSDKEIQELPHSCICVPVSYNSEIEANKKPENDKKHKVSISQDAPKEFNFSSMQLQSHGDVIQNTSINDKTIELNYKIDNFAQTDWCNTLLQAKCNEDGKYTFHIPSLHQLTKYNLL